MIITKSFCDVCKEELDPKNSGSVQGRIEKMTPEAELKQMMFGGDYCGEHFSQITDFIGTLGYEQKPR